MARKTDEITIAKIKKAYLAGEGTLAALALRFQVGERTVKRLSSEGNWDALKQARGTVLDGALRDRVSAAPSEFNPDALLKAAILDLAASLPECQVKSKESGAASMAKLITTWRQYNALSMSELVNLALSIESFDPREFARLLREQVEKAS